MSKPYRSIEEMLEIFQINLATAKAVLRKYKIDCFINKGKTYIHAKDFYAAYTKNFNPPLFDLKNTNKSKGIPAKKKSSGPDYSDIFQKLFGSSYETKKQRKVSERKLREEKRF